MLSKSQILSEIQERSIIYPAVEEKVSFTKYDGEEYPIYSFGLDVSGYTFRLDQAKYLSGLEVPIYTDPDSGRVYYLLPAGGYCLVSGVEYVNLPTNIAGILYPKSTYIRNGATIHGTVVDAGYKGQLTVGVFNASSHSVRLYRGEGIFQIVLEYVDNDQAYQGHYGKGVGIETSI